MTINTASFATHAQVEAFYNFVDAYKAVHNIKPRWYRPEDDTAEGWEAATRDLEDEWRDRARLEAEAEARHEAWVAEVTACRPLRVPLAAFMVG